MENNPEQRIEVAVALPVPGTFSYSVPDHFAGTAHCGKRVLVPFGSRRATGYVLGDADPDDQRPVKKILDVLDEDPMFPQVMVSLFRWAAGYYFHPIGLAIKGALPGGLNVFDVAVLHITPEGREALADRTAATPVERALLSGLDDKGPCGHGELERRTGAPVPRALVRSLDGRGLIERCLELKGGLTRAKQERFAVFVREPTALESLSGVKLGILAILRVEREASVARLKERFPTAAAHVSDMEKMGLVSIVPRNVYRDPLGEPIRPDVPPELTDEQSEAVRTVGDRLQAGFSAYLLSGVTGSGKTEVYLRLAAETVKRRRSVIVLVPEIALITQMERRFRARFGERVAVLHSGLSAGEKYDQWVRIAGGGFDIAVGARSAIFAPFERVGLIVVDEEHDGSFKQENGLHYNARDLAVVRARQNDAVVLLGSATPSVQSYHNVRTGKFAGLYLTRRVHRRPMPEVTVVDLRDGAYARGLARYITPPLYQGMKETLAGGDQVLLFLNRRGYANCSVCGSCGESLKCHHCDVPMTFHLGSNAYECHYCGFSRAAATPCPGCGSLGFRRLGLGTERLEKMVRELFPAASVARMDRDTTTRKGAVLKILKGLAGRSIDILVGTQMVTKGHDFPNITLVGIVCADLSLSVPDFRAGERTYQLLAQVSGRAGRGDMPGRVILQTFNPGHFSIRSAENQDYDTFFQREIGFRKALGYPPFTRFVHLGISGRNKAAAEGHAAALGERCRSLRGVSDDFVRSLQVLGPAQAPMPKRSGRYRWQILLKSTTVKPLQAYLRLLHQDSAALDGPKGVQVVVDVDPYAMT